MREYLRRSISSLNRNKLNGLLAEVDFRNTLSQIGFYDRVSVGGWIARSRSVGNFGENTIVLFPETMHPGIDYSASRALPDPTYGLHTICATFHQIGIRSYFCAPVLNRNDNIDSLDWKAIELGLPTQQEYESFPANVIGFSERSHSYNFLRYNIEAVTDIPESALAEEFTKENLRISFNNKFMAEISDVDGILWGRQFTYPLEIKEKTAAKDPQVGDFFGLDVGPFVKLAFYAAKGGNLNSLFIVREIDNPDDRNLIKWWYITFKELASYASWVPMGGGINMRGGGSTVIKIPKNRFVELNADTLGDL